MILVVLVSLLSNTSLKAEEPPTLEIIQLPTGEIRVTSEVPEVIDGFISLIFSGKDQEMALYPEDAIKDEGSLILSIGDISGSLDYLYTYRINELDYTLTGSVSFLSDTDEVTIIEEVPELNTAVSSNYLVFDGQTTSLKMKKALGKVPKSFTLEFVVKLDLNGNSQILFGNYTGIIDQEYINLEITSDKKLRYLEGGKGGIRVDLISKPLTPSANWTTISLVRNVSDIENKSIEFFQDGKSLGKFTNDSATVVGNVADIGVGLKQVAKYNVGTDSRLGKTPYFKGLMSEVRIWKKARTAAQITANINKNISGKKSGLWHLWRLKSDSLKKIKGIKDKVAKGCYLSGFTYWEDGIAPFAENTLLETSDSFNGIIKTVEAWIKLPKDFDDNTRSGVILGNYCENKKDNGAYTVFNFEINTKGRPRISWIYTNTTKLDITFNVDLRRDKYVHVAVAITSTKAICYVNGAKAATYKYSKTQKKYYKTLRSFNIYGPLAIGNDLRVDTEPKTSFKGRIADVRVWSNARTKSKIKANITSLANTTGLIGRWKLNETPEATHYKDSAKNIGDMYFGEKWLDPNIPIGDYSVVIMPDPQHITRDYPASVKKAFQWVIDNTDKYKIKSLICVGDMVQTTTSTTQWQNFKAASDLLTDIPFIPVIGNHDKNYPSSITPTTEYFNYYYPQSDFIGKTYPKAGSYTFGEGFDNKMENTYHIFETPKETYVIFTLSYDILPESEEFLWANTKAEEITQIYPNCKIILLTHIYIRCDGSYLKEGEILRDNFVNNHDNIIAVICGHKSYPDIVSKKVKSEKGHNIQVILCDAQDIDEVTKNGLSMLMILTFKDGSSDIKVNWYSVVKDKLYRNKNQFTITLN